jgi:hypothetical protein
MTKHQKNVLLNENPKLFKIDTFRCTRKVKKKTKGKKKQYPRA